MSPPSPIARSKARFAARGALQSRACARQLTLDDGGERFREVRDGARAAAAASAWAGKSSRRSTIHRVEHRTDEIADVGVVGCDGACACVVAGGERSDG